MKVLVAASLLMMASPAFAGSFLDFTDPDHACRTAGKILNFAEDTEPAKQNTDPPLQIDPVVDKENPLANLDPAFNWPEDSNTSDM